MHAERVTNAAYLILTAALEAKYHCSVRVLNLGCSISRRLPVWWVLIVTRCLLLWNGNVLK